jgi:hypothetical protein
MNPRAGIEALVRKAAYDDSGYSVEGAFVDSFRYRAEDAAGALANLFAAHGFTAADEALIRDAVRDPAAGKEAPPIMLSTLIEWTRPLDRTTPPRSASPRANARTMRSAMDYTGSARGIPGRSGCASTLDRSRGSRQDVARQLR